MTSRFLSGDNGTGGHLHDFPSLSGRTGLYTRVGSGCNGQSTGTAELPAGPRADLGTPVLGSPCAILIHGLHERLDRAEDLVPAEPLHQARDEPLPLERL